MADLATPDFLSSLKALYPPDTPNAPSHLWTVVAAVAFSASNAPNAVPAIFSYALDDLVASQHAAATAGDAAREEQLVLARKVREAVLQSGLLSGMPRAINTLVALHQVMPEHLREAKPLRDTRRPPAEWDRRGAALFSAVYRDTAPSVESLLDAAYPDLGWFCTTVGYGMTYGGTDVLSVVELVYVMVAALIAVDAPRQVGWHLANARRGARGGAGGEGHRHPGGGEGGGEVAKRRPGGGGVKRGDAGEEGGGPVRWGPVRCTDGLSVRVPRMFSR